MKDHEFEARLIGWLDMPGEGDPYPKDANPYPADLRDARFDALCSLYLEADEVRRAQIPALFAREESTRAYARIAEWIASGERARNDLSNLIFYMRRVALSIDSGGDAWRLRLGLAAAAILQEREDYRDIIVSLAFLHYAAGRAGIDPDPFFREVAHLTRPETEEFVVSFPERDEAEIENMVEAFLVMDGRTQSCCHTWASINARRREELISQRPLSSGIPETSASRAPWET